MVVSWTSLLNSTRKLRTSGTFTKWNQSFLYLDNPLNGSILSLRLILNNSNVPIHRGKPVCKQVCTSENCPSLKCASTVCTQSIIPPTSLSGEISTVVPRIRSMLALSTNIEQDCSLGTCDEMTALKMPGDKPCKALQVNYFLKIFFISNSFLSLRSMLLDLRTYQLHQSMNAERF